MPTFTNDELQQLFDSPVGQDMWDFLNADSIIARMQTDAMSGEPIEDALYGHLVAQWKKELKDHDVHDLFKEMVYCIMKCLGYTLIARDFHVNTIYRLSTSSRYKITRHKPSVFDIMGVGRSQMWNNNKIWLQRNDTNHALFDLFFDEPNVVAEIIGKAVFEDFDTTNCQPPMNRDIFEPGSAVTILSELSIGEIYLRIMYFYRGILTQWLENLQQDVIIYGENKGFTISARHIEKSEAYIRCMTLYPKESDLKDLAEEILSGVLEYAFHAKDEYGVKMSQYAKALIKRL